MISHQTLNLTSKLALLELSFSAPLRTLSQSGNLAFLYVLKGCHP